jgi:hypothetical protein
MTGPASASAASRASAPAILFQAEKAALEHDFTVWTGESEFFPLSEPRSFVATNIESFFRAGLSECGISAAGSSTIRGRAAPGPRNRRPGIRSAGPWRSFSRSTPRRRRRERRALFHRIEAINAEEVWHISICTPPPQLVVVKNGFRNVPRNAVFGSIYNSPGNAGLETYFWDEPADPAAVVAATKRAVVEITPDPAARLPAAAPRIPTSPAAGIPAGGALRALGLLGGVAGNHFRGRAPPLHRPPAAPDGPHGAGRLDRGLCDRAAAPRRLSGGADAGIPDAGHGGLRAGNRGFAPEFPPG